MYLIKVSEPQIMKNNNPKTLSVLIQIKKKSNKNHSTQSQNFHTDLTSRKPIKNVRSTRQLSRSARRESARSRFI